MCGICGIRMHDSTAAIDRDTLRSMTEALAHRGPDQQGFHVEPGIGLGSRRLRVIDLEGGKQPLANEDGSRHIVFNGEIYNYERLRRDCERRGHRFESRSDTETIVHLYEDHGSGCLQHLNGMFAFAIWDSTRSKLLLARDRLGIKPLYYARLDDRFLFASELRALLCCPELPREIDPVALDQFLTYKFVPGPRTIYRNVCKLLPGHFLDCSVPNATPESFWAPSYAPFDAVELPEARAEIERRLDAAVERQLVSDVPLGVLLSGGIDSSLLVALMRKRSGDPIRTFSIGFTDPSFNELDHARTVAARFGTEHHERIVDPDVGDLLEKVVARMDEPFADASVLPTYLLCALAREHVTVALSGTGADEVFAGYDRYLAHRAGRALAALPGPFRRALRAGVRAAKEGRGKRNVVMRARRLLDAHARDAIDRHRGILGLFSDAQRRRLYARPEYGAPAGNTWGDDSGLDPFRCAYAASDAPDELSRLLDVDTRITLADDYLLKDDRMSMVHSLELRVPYLDHTLFEYVAALPVRYKLRGWTTKFLLKQVAAKLLPESIVRRPKHGFEVPLGSWLAGPLRGPAEDLLLSPRAQSRDLFDIDYVAGLLCRHWAGEANLSREIWALMVLELWLREHIERS